MAGSISPISSRNRVPPRAAAIFPLSPLPAGTGIGAAHMAEQLPFKKFRRYGPAVDGHKGPVICGGAEIVDQSGDQFLARAALPLDEHGYVPVLAELLGQMNHLLHPCRAVFEVIQAHFL